VFEHELGFVFVLLELGFGLQVELQFVLDHIFGLGLLLELVLVLELAYIVYIFYNKFDNWIVILVVVD